MKRYLLLYNGLGLEHGASVVGLIQTHPNALGVADAIRAVQPEKILWKGTIPDPHVWMDVSLWAETIDPITESCFRQQRRDLAFNFSSEQVGLVAILSGGRIATRTVAERFFKTSTFRSPWSTFWAEV